MSKLSRCLNDKSISDYLAGRSSPQLTDDIAAHLRACPACQARLADHPDQSDFMRMLYGSGANDPTELSVCPAGSSFGAMPHFIRDYKLVQKLGGGGQGNVYLAIHTRLGKQRAVKLLRSDRIHDPQSIARFEREMLAVGKLDHPHIVRAHDAGEEGGIHFLAMEYVDGIDLASLLRVQGALPVPESCELIRQAALGLEHAHLNELVHRDVKPSNLMLSKDGCVKVLDLGLAQLNVSLASELTQNHQVLGTLRYVAPEQLVAGVTVDKCSDVYSLGITLYELLVGVTALRQTSVPMLAIEVRETRSDVPAELWALLRQMLARSNEERPQSMESIASALAVWSQGTDMSAFSQTYARRNASRFPPPIPVRLGSEVTTEVVPPPITTSLPLIAHVPVRISPSPAYTSRPKSSTAWLRSAATLLLLICLSALAYKLWPSGSDGGKKGPATPPLTAQITTTSEDTVIRQSIAAHKFELEDIHTGRTFPLQIGPSEVPPGEYKLICLASEFECKLQRNIVLKAGDQVSVVPERTHAKSLLTPRIPNSAGDFLTLYGTLWYRGLGVAETEPITLTIKLEALHSEMVAGIKHRWIMVKTQQHIANGDYKETGYLLINPESWDVANSLSIQRGWLIAESPTIESRIEEIFPDSKVYAIATPFDPQRDTVANAAARHSLPLPAHRVTVHQALLTFFGDLEISAAPEDIRNIRPKLGALRQLRESLALVSTGNGPIPCLDIEGFHNEMKLFTLRRNDEIIPFSFLEINVNVPKQFAAQLTMQSYGIGSAVANNPATFGESMVSSAEVLQGAFASLQVRPEIYDRAPFPADGKSAIYTGELVLAKSGPTIKYKIYLRAGPEVSIGDRNCRRLDISVESEVASSAGTWREDAVLFVDQERLHEIEFDIAKGWLIIEGETFEFRPSRDSAEIEQQLARLGHDFAPPKLGVDDALTLIFDAQLASAEGLRNLRQYLRGEMTLLGIEKMKRLDTLTLYDGREVQGSVWELPHGDSNSPRYHIKRSAELDFAFASVAIVTADVQFTAKLDGEEWTGLPDQSPAQLQIAADATAAKSDTHRPNWHVFTRSSEGRRELIWAELGGEFRGVTYVRPRDGIIREMPTNQLAADDQVFASEGREWTISSVKIRAPIVQLAPGAVRLKVPESGPLGKAYGESKFSSDDKAWIEYIRQRQRTP